MVRFPLEGNVADTSEGTTTEQHEDPNALPKAAETMSPGPLSDERADALSAKDCTLTVDGLKIVLPNNKVLIESFSMEVNPGEVAVLLGGSGAGKSTFARVLFEPNQLSGSGFDYGADTLTFDRTTLGLVPQRGALFDHLDVRGNLEIAMRYSDHPSTGDISIEEWLSRVGLDPRLAEPGTDVGTLSGGQAQRVAVARVLAGRRQLLFLDEPSVGLDPHRVRMLARLIRDQVERYDLAAIVVTHDVALAAGVADQLYLLNTKTRHLDHLFADEWPGPCESENVSEEERGEWLVRLESELVDRIEEGDGVPLKENSGEAVKRSPLAWIDEKVEPLYAPFTAAGMALRYMPSQLFKRPRDFFAVSARVVIQTLLRPLPFYAIVSTLIGFTILYVVSKVGGAGVRPDALIRQIGGSHIIALAPALSGILFVSASGSATNAWLGSMGLTKQTMAMEALGVRSRAYLWSPSWFTLGLCYIAVAMVFALGMVLGGMLVCNHYGMDGSWELLTADIFDPRPERAKYTSRAALLVWIYAWGIASDVIAKGGADKREAEAVTRGMTASVVACTLWMVALELITVMVVLNK